MLASSVIRTSFNASARAVAWIGACLMLVAAQPAFANTYYLQGNTTSYLSYSYVPGLIGNPSSVTLCYEMVGKPDNATWSVAGQKTTTGSFIVTAPVHPIPVVTSGIPTTQSSGPTPQYISIAYALGPGPGCGAPMDFDYLVVDPQTTPTGTNDGTITPGYTGNWFDTNNPATDSVSRCCRAIRCWPSGTCSARTAGKRGWSRLDLSLAKARCCRSHCRLARAVAFRRISIRRNSATNPGARSRSRSRIAITDSWHGDLHRRDTPPVRCRLPG